MAQPDLEELRRRIETSEHKRASLLKRLAQGNSDEDATLWSFVDLLSLLLILFILFYSHALAKNESVPKASAQTRKNPAIQSAREVAIAAAGDSKVEPLRRPERDAPDTTGERQDEALEHLKQQILTVASNRDEDDLTVRWDQKRLIVTLGERIMFGVGMANLLSDSEPTLRKIAGFIASQKGYRVLVAGHTDNTPINTARFPSNWELSTARAVNVAKFLIAQGVTPERVSIEGYSSHRPLYPNTSRQNRQANRRVEITLFKDHKAEIDNLF